MIEYLILTALFLTLFLIIPFLSRLKLNKRIDMLFSFFESLEKEIGQTRKYSNHKIKYVETLALKNSDDIEAMGRVKQWGVFFNL